jgi:hypothetical protein
VGDNAASLFSGSWQAGDQILGLGLSYGGGQSGISFFFHLDMAGDSIQSASELGASAGNYSANAGDTSAYFTGGASGSNKFRNLTYSVFNAYTPNGSNNFTVPYGAGGNLNAPGRGFAVLAPSSTSSVGSAQFFFNLSAMARGNGGAGFGEGTYGNSSRVGFFESGSAGAAQVFSQQVFANSSAVPLPAAVSPAPAASAPLPWAATPALTTAPLPMPAPSSPFDEPISPFDEPSSPFLRLVGAAAAAGRSAALAEDSLPPFAAPALAGGAPAASSAACAAR